MGLNYLFLFQTTQNTLSIYLLIRNSLNKNKENTPVIKEKDKKEKQRLHAIQVSAQNGQWFCVTLKCKQHNIEVKTRNIFYEPFFLFQQ